MKWMSLLREDEGITQAELAQRLMYSRYTISRLESGQAAITTVGPRLRLALEQHFQWPLESLLADIPIPHTAPEANPHEDVAGF